MGRGRPAGQQRSRAGERPVFLSLAQRTDLPPRVRTLLDGLLEQACAWFEPAILHALDETEHALFKLAERSGNSAQQQKRFEDLREVKIGRADVAPRFLQHAESLLAQTRLAPGAAAPGEARAARSGLELIDATAFEEDLALQEIAGKAEVRNSQSLYALSHRLAVIAGMPAWPLESMPLGPAMLAAAYQFALGAMELGVEHRVLAYRQFDRCALLPVAPFYERANEWLVIQRILPHLHRPGIRRAEEPPRQAAVSEPRPTDAAPQETTRAQADGRARPEPERAHDPAARAAVDASLFETLTHFLHERRRIDGDAGAVPASSMPASRADLQTVLGSMQRAPRPAGGHYDSEHFRNTLLVKLRRASPEGRPLGLGEEELDTVDLVGMLFDYITRNVREGSAARELLARLHVPVLRVALGDRSFFTRRDHPARELLNTIAETGARWMEEAGGEPDVSLRMERVVERVSKEFDGDLGLFEKLLDDLGHHMQVLARRAEVVERRHIDAAKGRDRLDIARESARGAIMRVIQEGSPSPRVQALLEHAWADALALSALRDSSAGSGFRRRLAVAGELVQRGGRPFTDSPEDVALRRDLHAGLIQVGMHEDDIGGILDHLHEADAGSAAGDRPDPVEDALRTKMRLGGEAETAAGPTPALLDATELALLEQLKHTAFGTWFEFVLGMQGTTARRKLAWFSPVTGRCLIVTARGARCEDYTLARLAREMKLGQVRVAPVEDHSLIDRAWKAILTILKPQSGAAATRETGA
jgi:hypothetical protein